ncbi:MAG: hypothetical protein L6R35_002543 [Caloplaca aegaea]|nr:MAG: hypothetical protein L6R35_002543 [Caloplaca aegaea]
MVYYFTSNVVEPAATLYVGKDKFENEELIKYGWDEDFHVDNLSSAHVYLRLKPGQEWDQIPAALVDDCAQLTKANSIEGNKKDNVTVIYTPWSNLLKNASMATGQVSFRDPKKVCFFPIHFLWKGQKKKASPPISLLLYERATTTPQSKKEFKN